MKVTVCLNNPEFILKYVHMKLKPKKRHPNTNLTVLEIMKIEISPLVLYHCESTWIQI